MARAVENIPTLSASCSTVPTFTPPRTTRMAPCVAKAQTYTSPRYAVPTPVPAGGIVVAANAGSDYLFVPDGDATRSRPLW